MMQRREAHPPIPDGEYTLRYVRSSGPGGQNVNKVATACELRFAVGGSTLLDDAGKERLRTLAGRRLTLTDEIVLEAHRHRSREANRRDALHRLADLLARASVRPKARRPTRPTRAARARRLEGKRLRKRAKRLRARPPLE
jgi:ribosome-associated protein